MLIDANRPAQITLSERMKYRAAHSVLNNAQNIAIFMHEGVDGDCLGSAYGLKALCQQMGKNAYVCLPGGEYNKTLDVIDRTPDDNEIPSQNADLCVIVDGSYEHLAPIAKQLYDKYVSNGAKTLCFDHHLYNSNTCQQNCVIDRSSAAEVLYEMCKTVAIIPKQAAANNILVGLVSDSQMGQTGKSTDNTRKYIRELGNICDNLDAITANYNYRTPGEQKLLDVLLKNSTDLGDGISYSHCSINDVINCEVDFEAVKGMMKYYKSEANTDLAILSCGPFEKDIYDPNYDGAPLYYVRMQSSTRKTRPILEPYGGRGHEYAAWCKVIADNPDEVFKQVKGMLDRYKSKNSDFAAPKLDYYCKL
ncbi:MAG: DHH family phosphoesterase [Clostridiales bacterium]|nr:DHH family phosphoesterase [Clostridiales bacterium]